MLKESLHRLGRSSTMETLVTRTPLRGMSRRFVAGETLDDLVEAVRGTNDEGLKATANYLGESETSEVGVRRAAEMYLRILERIADERLESGISVKFTQLGQDIDRDLLRRTLEPLLDRAGEDGVFVRFDMESSDYTERTLDAFEELWAAGRRGIGVVLQSYLRRTAADVRRMNALGAPVRLCKGAYDEPAEVAFQDRREVNDNFVRCMELLLAEGMHPAIATHDRRMIDATVRFASQEGLGRQDFEFQMIYGVRRDLQRELREDGWDVRVYIPFGEAWYPYLMRRLAERPANVVFLVGSVLRESPLGFLWPEGNGRR